MNDLIQKKEGSRLYACIRDVYNTYRTELLNKKYYGYRLATFKSTSTFFDVAIAIGTSTVIGAWAIWHTEIGQVVWAVLSGLVFLLTVIKPCLNLPARIEQYTNLFSGHSVTSYDLKAIVSDIGRSQNYTEAIHDKYIAMIERAKDLSNKDDPSPRNRLLERCFQEVNKQHPASSFWWPPKGV